MTTRFVLAITTDGERAVVRERRERVEQPRLVGIFHLGEVTALEGLPLRLALRGLAELEQRLARCERWEPHVVEVAPRPVRFGHAAWRPPHCADAQAFATGTRTAEPHDRD